MKKLSEQIESAQEDQGISRIKGMWEKYTDKARNGEFSCPFCREVCKGLSAFGSHLKSHCT